MFRKITGKRGAAIISLLLSAALIVEPAGMALTVHAQEGSQVTARTEADVQEGSTGDQDSAVQDSDKEDSGHKDEGQMDDKKPEQGENGDTEPSTGENTENGDSQPPAGGDNEGGDSNSSGGEEDGPGSAGGDGEDDSKPSTGENGEGGDLSTDEGQEGETPEENPDEAEEGEEIEEGAETEEEGDLTPEEEADDEKETETEETEEEDKDKEENEVLEGFEEMPSTYRLTSEQMESKRDLADHLDEIGEYSEGDDYAARELVTFAGSEEEAQMIADAYNADIVSFEYGILTLKLGKKTTVYRAMRAASEEEINLPAVWPNYYRYAFVEDTETETDENKEAPETEGATGDGIEIETSEYEADEQDVTAETADGEYTEASYLAVLTDSDPYLQPESGYYQYHHTIIGSAYAWAEGYKGQGIKVAVLDSGVANHSDLSVTSIMGSADTQDSVGHGTHVAGIIGAKANGSLGVGVAPEASLSSANVLPNGSGTDADIMRALMKATEQRVDVVNMSLGGLGYSGAFQTVVDDAYNAGIAIFAASGNDGGMNYSYPACYDHVISVAATDKNNIRASFSNYGNKVDLSAPGVTIWSANSANASQYIGKSGTSMACPVAAGEAAVILSGNESLRNMSGGARVDALEKLMKGNAIKAGSGMGAGITNLAKVFKLNTAAAKPSAPVITVTPDNTAAAQKVTITITSQSGRTQDGMSVYYTTNGKTPSYKNGMPGSGTLLYEGSFDIQNSAKGTIKAIVVNKSGVSSSVRSVSYKLKPYVSSIVISGVQQVAKGKSIQLSASIQPSYATNKSVVWELYNEAGEKIDAKANAVLAKQTGVSISTKGKVTASKSALPGTYTVRVKAKDRGADSVQAEYEIAVIDKAKIKSVKFTSKSVTLVLPTQKSAYDLSDKFVALQTDGSAAETKDFRWTSSNASIATVDANGMVMPLKAGKVTITALADDSSGKKATCTVTVKQLATGISISGLNTVAAGKSLSLKAEIAPSTTTNKKAKWTLWDDEGEVDAKRAKTLGVKISASNGKVTTTTKARPGDYTVKATTTDGSALTAEKIITVKKGVITGFAFSEKSFSKVTLFRKESKTSKIKTTATIQAKINAKDGADLTAYKVTSSNPGIATAEASGTNGTITIKLKATGKATGKTSVTIAATDGSNKKLVCAVTVNNPVSGITVAPTGSMDKYVAKGKSLQLKATVETENGTVSNKGVTWELYARVMNPQLGYAQWQKIDSALSKATGMKISSGGKITASKKALDGSYMVRAVAKDNSGAVGTYTVSVAAPATQIYLISGGGKMSTSATWGLAPGKLLRAPLFSNQSQGGIAVSSSNPAVISATYSAYGTVDIITYKKGSATITIKALDGSNKQVKYKFVVK